VKVRGFRIELGEIEAVLLKHPAWPRRPWWRERMDRAGKHWSPMSSPAAGAAEDTTELRAALRQMLPDYMVPNALCGPDGAAAHRQRKVNRKPFPRGSPRQGRRLRGAAHTHRRSPRRHLARVLGLEAVGLNDNFFDLGGHSLLAMRVMARVQEVFEASVPVRLLFEAPTLEAFAEALLAELLGDAAEDELAS
jgi:aryl carrier-like protein